MNAVCVYDFTSYEIDNREEIKEWLKENTKKWCYQLERGEQGGKLHFQGRFSLKVKTRESTLLKKLPKYIGHISITSGANKDNEFYVMKVDTRVEGPWTDRTDVYVPRQVREIKKLYPWQQSVIDDADVWDTRHINIIVDTKGNIGKSILVSWIRAYKIGKKLVYSNDFRDIMRAVLCMGASKLYVVDIPRAIKKDKLFQLMGALEEIKNGYAYDDRYEFKDIMFDCPNIWVFTNTIPDTELMSQDRWRYWEINDRKELVEYKKSRKPTLVIVPEGQSEIDALYGESNLFKK